MDSCFETPRDVEPSGEIQPLYRSRRNTLSHFRSLRIGQQSRSAKFSKAAFKLASYLMGLWKPTKMNFIICLVIGLICLYQLVYDLYIVIACPGSDCGFVKNATESKNAPKTDRATENTVYTLGSLGAAASYLLLVVSLLLMDRRNNRALAPSQAIDDLSRTHTCILCASFALNFLVFASSVSLFYVIVCSSQPGGTFFYILLTGVGCQLVAQWASIVGVHVFATSSLALGTLADDTLSRIGQWKKKEEKTNGPTGYGTLRNTTPGRTGDAKVDPSGAGDGDAAAGHSTTHTTLGGTGDAEVDPSGAGDGNVAAEHSTTHTTPGRTGDAKVNPSGAGDGDAAAEHSTTHTTPGRTGDAKVNPSGAGDGDAAAGHSTTHTTLGGTGDAEVDPCGAGDGNVAAEHSTTHTTPGRTGDAKVNPSGAGDGDAAAEHSTTHTTPGGTGDAEADPCGAGDGDAAADNNTTDYTTVSTGNKNDMTVFNTSDKDSSKTVLNSSETPGYKTVNSGDTTKAGDSNATKTNTDTTNISVICNTANADNEQATRPKKNAEQPQHGIVPEVVVRTPGGVFNGVGTPIASTSNREDFSVINTSVSSDKDDPTVGEDGYAVVDTDNKAGKNVVSRGLDQLILIHEDLCDIVDDTVSAYSVWFVLHWIIYGLTDIVALIFLSEEITNRSKYKVPNTSFAYYSLLIVTHIYLFIMPCCCAAYITNTCAGIYEKINRTTSRQWSADHPFTDRKNMAMFITYAKERQCVFKIGRITFTSGLAWFSLFLGAVALLFHFFQP